MAASLSYCPKCPLGKAENKRISKRERRIYHKLLRRINKQFTCTETQEYTNPNPRPQ